jgi:protease-4
MKRFGRMLVVVALVLSLLWLFLPAGGVHVESGSTLVMRLQGAYVEASDSPLVLRVIGGGPQPLLSLLSELRKAKRDDRIESVVLRIRGLQIGWAKAQEIRDAIRELADAGKRTVAYLEIESFGSNLEYYVATAADGIYAAPGTRAPLVGLAAEYLFFGDALAELGIDFEVERIGEFKSATETFTRTHFSGPAREMANSLLDSIDAGFVAGIAERRGLTEDFVRNTIDHAPVTPDQMLAMNLIDGIAFYDEVLAELGGGPIVHGDDYASVDPLLVGFVPEASFALVYGSGPVVTGGRSNSPAGSVMMASDVVSRAILEAAEDDAISAILFRIDSPGGSPLASDIIWRAIQQARSMGKPVIASLSDVAASGGYYVACGADAIVADAATLTGSIGVFVLRPVFEKLLGKLDIGVEVLTRGAHADLLIGSRPLSEGSRSLLRAEVRSIYDLFVHRVAAGRSLTVEQVDALGRGRVWTGAQALEHGLIDEIGGLHAAATRAKLAVGLDADADVSLVPYPSSTNLADQISEVLRRMAISVRPALPLESLAARIEPWWALAGDAPSLLPPFLVEIR